MADHAERFRDAIVDALPSFLRDRIESLGLDPTDLASEIDDAVATVSDRLSDLLTAPFDRQDETPLEVVRLALEPVQEAITAAGAPRMVDDDGFGIGPASAAELGAEPLETSLAWGLAKTEALGRPTVLVVTANLMDASRFEPVAARAGYRIEVDRGAGCSTTPLVAFVDLEVEGARDIVRRLAGDGVRVVAYGPHVDDQALVAATALGAIAAEPRSRVFTRAQEHLPPLV